MNPAFFYHSRLMMTPVGSPERKTLGVPYHRCDRKSQGLCSCSCSWRVNEGAGLRYTGRKPLARAVEVRRGRIEFRDLGEDHTEVSDFE